MKKILFTSHVANFVKFNARYIEWFKSQGWTVHYASMGEEEIHGCDKVFSLPFSRSMLSADNIKAYRGLKKLIENESYDIVHCHTPTASVVTRFAARKARKTGTKVLYTCHGFSFYQGAPWHYWLILYPIEKFFSRYADALILINNEDYALAMKHRFKSKKIYRINGVGIDTSKFSPADKLKKNELRAALSIDEGRFAVLYCAEFIGRKNHAFVINLIPRLLEINENIKFLFLGKGALLEKSKQLAKSLGVSEYVDFLGYQSNMQEFYRAADVEISASKNEGQGIHLLEAMACGLPVVATNVQGHKDFIEDGENGFLYSTNDTEGFIAALTKLMRDKKLCDRMRRNNINEAGLYDCERLLGEMVAVYRKHM